MTTNRILLPSRRGVTGRAWGFALVVAAAALWGTDGVFRRGLALELSPATLVFWEHMVLVVITVPFLRRALTSARQFGLRQWLAVILIGAGASAIATTLFTAAFRYGDPTTPLLLQKLQPVLAVIAARLLLGERIRIRYLPLFGVSLLGGWLITFADPTNVAPGAAAAGAFAIGAAALWGMGTVLGRYMTAFVPPDEITALRFAIGLPTAGLLAIWNGGSTGLVIEAPELGSVVVLALIPGMLALMIYYRGLRTTPASLATLAELAFPLSAITLNRLFFGVTVTATQWTGVVILSAVLVLMSAADRSDTSDVLLGVKARQTGQSMPALESQAG